ncbi:metal-dependent transcriptional regulator [Corynebacterium sp. 320]|uniref:metal-dependent transcriptional regulator n=1 Tax=Corynebacterium TaxID=1716 RepID=UPI00125CADF2|nr:MULTISPECIES: metal-dependent transcriptional regulator [Corynebacterium]KAB1504046.1 metal-dependent transcriptional regulator [Corynebacterium sp. 320]KAB1552855.1 metal-dependent transcriptional regulator [Corynebacterium sp. 321]KAB1553927.1 metal-dependent transcriptional regulator [Corynebacterium sp. 319]KAB3528182.1 metal-dependent transcriptional regulator [Corynebacterium sp. 250]KAB3540330.1 metal-dependent transcriptional regulator [Corynebacterium sp. 366]
MHIDDLPDRTQDYLKKIYDLQEWGPGATLSSLAEHMGQRKSTTSEAIKRLVAQDLVEHAPYGDIQLTDQGTTMALAMIRRHRMIETYLCTELGYSLDEVHDEAEILEHAVSERFLEKISAVMGHPTRDPHGDPIPDAHGNLRTPPTLGLREVEPGERVYIDRISDREGDLLKYLYQHGVQPGVQVEMQPRVFADMAELSIIDADGQVHSRVQLPSSSLGAVMCRRVQEADLQADQVPDLLAGVKGDDE